MELTDEVTIPARSAQVYAALNDTDVLRKCIPGCQEITRHSATELEAKVVLKIGPVKARFTGAVVLEPVDPPREFHLTGSGTGGAAGFAKGGAQIILEEDGDQTLLRYTARADVGGKLAQLGSRLIMGTTRKLAAQFFGNLAAELTDIDAGTPKADA
ncbi:CoxG family protein [Roseinatronobacter sp. NSM]|uniref:CoxG family protein n=1 Tax=Roseinatronobacter sp. NSM TaxID=3457785 RepID=UPI0040359772